MNFVAGTPLPAPSPSAEPPAPKRLPDRAKLAWGMVAAISLALLWSYWPTLANIIERWSTDPQYSHGFLVPFFAATILWFRREKLANLPWTPNAWGIPVLLAGLGMRLFSVSMEFGAGDGYSLLVCIIGAVLFIGGLPVLKWSWPAVAFLAFMVPPPFSIEGMLGHPLRRIATVMSTYLLQTFGYPALSEGNIIVIDQLRLGVIEACSGLGMLMTFFALATAIVIVIDVPWTHRLVLIGSAIPIAVLANVIRITATGMVYYATGNPNVQATMHDLAGWFMMPLALGFFWLVLKFVDRLFIVEKNTPDRPLPLFPNVGAKAGANVPLDKYLPK